MFEVLNQLNYNNSIHFLIHKLPFYILQTQGAGVFIKSKAGAPTAIPNQLVAFEKLQRHAISRFSKERVYSMLKTVMQHLRAESKQTEKENTKSEEKSAEKEQKPKGNSPDSEGSKEEDSKSNDGGKESVSKEEPLMEKKDKSPEVNEKDQTTTNNQNENKKQFVKVDIKIQSVRQVREVIKIFQTKEKEGKASEAEINAIKNFDTFINDLSYLKQLKEYFGEHINKCLYRHYFDAADFVGLSSRDHDSLLQSHSESPPNKSKSQKGNGKKGKKVITEEEQLEMDKISLSRTARDLQEIQNKWHGLMLDSSLDLDNFDQDSHYELMQFVNYSTFESVLRLVPDIFVKCYKSIELAREWWALAQKIYKDRLPLNWVPSPVRKSVTPVPVPEPVRKSKTPEVKPVENKDDQEIIKAELDRQTENIQKHITEIGQTIEKNEQQLETIGMEIDTLRAREMRSEDLTSRCERVDMDIKQHEEEHRKFLVERKKIQDQIASTKLGNSKKNELMEKMRMLEMEANRKQNLIKMKQFEKSLKQEDYLLELEIKPSFILFVADMKEKMTQIKQDVADKKLTKLKLERQLSLIESNTDKMKEMLKRYIKSASSRENPELTRDFSRIAKELEDDLNSLRTLESRGSNITIATETDVSLTEFLPDGALDDEEFDPWERNVQEPSRNPAMQKTKTGKAIPKNNFARKGSRSKVLQEA